MQIIFSGTLGLFRTFESFENRVPLKPVLGGVASVASLITGHEQTQLNRVCYFHFFGMVNASKGSNKSELTNP